MPGLFITGTDTGVGKTLVTTTLLESLRHLGVTALGMKPVAAGCDRVDGVWVNEDVARIRAASAVALPERLVNPYLFREAIAPHIAAEHKGVKIEIRHIVESYEALAAQAKWVLVEGVGGFMVPINARQDMAALAVALNLPVILVVGMRLGCLSHALLTQEAVVLRGLPLAGWVANQLEPRMAAYNENLATLQQRLQVPLIAEIPFLSVPDPLHAMGFVANRRLLAVLDGIADVHSGAE